MNQECNSLKADTYDGKIVSFTCLQVDEDNMVLYQNDTSTSSYLHYIKLVRNAVKIW